VSRLRADLVADPAPVALDLGPGEAALVGVEAVGPLTGIGLRLLERRRHEVRLDGRRLDRYGPAGRVRRGLGVISGAPVAADVSVLDQLAAVRGVAAAAAVLADAPLLARRGGDPAGILSGGERRVLAWLRCQLTRPRAVVLDAAGTGLDADTLAWCQRVVEGWRAEGVAVVVRAGRDEERAWAAPG